MVSRLPDWKCLPHHIKECLRRFLLRKNNKSRNCICADWCCGSLSTFVMFCKGFFCVFTGTRTGGTGPKGKFRPFAVRSNWKWISDARFWRLNLDSNHRQWTKMFYWSNWENWAGPSATLKKEMKVPLLQWVKEASCSRWGFSWVFLQCVWKTCVKDPGRW